MTRRVLPAYSDGFADLPLFAQTETALAPALKWVAAKIRAPRAAAPFSNETTSKAAAESIAPVLGDLEQKAMEFIQARGWTGATCEEVEGGTGLKHQTASARIRGLFLKGLIKDSGKKRATSSGRPAAVWVMA